MPIRCDTAEKRLPVSVRLQCQQPVDGHSEKPNCRAWVGGSDGGETVVYTGASGKFELTAGKRKVYAVSAEEWRIVSGAEIEARESGTIVVDHQRCVASSQGCDHTPRDTTRLR